MNPKNHITADAFHPLKDNVFVTDLDHGPHRTPGGLLLADDNMSPWGIHARWGKVWCVGPDVTEVKPGEWVFIEHGRWTNEIEFHLPDGPVRVWRIDWPNAVLLAAPTDPREQITVTLPHVNNPKSSRNLVRSKAPFIHRFR